MEHKQQLREIDHSTQCNCTEESSAAGRDTRIRTIASAIPPLEMLRRDYMSRGSYESSSVILPNLSVKQSGGWSSDNRAPYGDDVEAIIDSEREKQIQKRKAQNRLAQRKFRSQNKIQIRDLQKRLETLTYELKDLKENNVRLENHKKEIQDKVRDLVTQNAHLRSLVFPTGTVPVLIPRSEP